MRWFKPLSSPFRVEADWSLRILELDFRSKHSSIRNTADWKRSESRLDSPLSHFTSTCFFRRRLCPFAFVFCCLSLVFEKSKPVPDYSLSSLRRGSEDWKLVATVNTLVTSPFLTERQIGIQKQKRECDQLRACNYFNRRRQKEEKVVEKRDRREISLGRESDPWRDEEL